MSEFKKGDEVILVPPVEMDSDYIPWVGRYAKVVDARKESGRNWYKIVVNGGEAFTAPEEWLRTPEPVCHRHS